MFNFTPCNILIFTSASIISILGGLMLSIRFPTGDQWSNLRLARNSLSLCFLILAGFSFIHFLMLTKVSLPIFRNLLILFIAACQALFFTATYIIFMQPAYKFWRFVIPQIIIITLIGFSLFIIAFFTEKSHPALLYAGLTIYLIQIAAYVLLFRKKYTLYITQMEDYYDEEQAQRTKWVRLGFYSALIVGLMAPIVALTGGHAYNLFIIIYTLYYAFVVNIFINYIHYDMQLVLPAVSQGNNRPQKVNNDTMTDGEQEEIRQKEVALKEELDRWITEKRFSKTDIGVEETAREMGTDTQFLRYFFRTHMQTDFRTWRSEIRIREAQNIWNDDPGISIARVCEMIGFNDKGNFHRQFCKFIGTTPTEYRRECIERAGLKRPGFHGLSSSKTLSSYKTRNDPSHGSIHTANGIHVVNGKMVENSIGKTSE